MSEAERQPKDKQEVLARCRWRVALDSNDYDEAFWRHYDALPNTKKSDLDDIIKVARETKPRLAAARALADDLRAAKRNFLAAGGTEQEWAATDLSVREEILRRSALGENKPLARAEMERRAAATGNRIFDARTDS